MKLNEINSWGMLVANIGVVAGIIFLAFEIRQNTVMMEAATRDSMTQQLTNWQISIATNTESALIYQKGIRGGAELEREKGENIAYAFMQQSIFRIWENEWYQYDLGLYEENEFVPRLERWERNFRTEPGMRAMWEGSRNSFSPGFRQTMDDIILKIDAELESAN